MALAGGHNALNVAAAIACVASASASPRRRVRRVLGEFRGPAAPDGARRARSRGVRFYDDSKGTNVGAAVTALEGLREPRAVLIAGGRDKGGSYAPLVDALARKGRAAVLIGEAADAIARAVGDRAPGAPRGARWTRPCASSATLARPGDAVLLSPACSSFDMFRDYKHRGDEFVRAVRALAEGGRDDA